MFKLDQVLAATLAAALVVGCESEIPRPTDEAGKAPQGEAAAEPAKDAAAPKKPDAPLLAWSPSPVLEPGTINVEKFEIVGEVKQKAPDLGAKIENATIYVDTDVRGAEQTQPDENGQFKVAVTYGTFRALRIEAPGYVGEELSRDTLIGWISKSPKRKTTSAMVYLTPGREVQGTVVAGDQPVEGVVVRCVAKGMRGTPDLGSTVLSDAEGAFRVDCPVESIKLLAVHPEFLHGVTDWIDLEQAPDANPKIELKRGARLLGRVVDASGRPVPQAILSISPGGDAPSPMHAWEEWRLHLEPGPFWRLAESDGSFDYGPKTGRLKIRAEQGDAEGTLDLDLSGQQEQYVEIALGPPDK